jgi:hypothetical protein
MPRLLWLRAALALVFLIASSRPATAQERKPAQEGRPSRLTAVEVPPELAPWVPWALAGKEESLCPVVLGGAAACAYVTRVDLDLGDKGGSFSARVRLDARGVVPLPGGDRRWPQDVKVDGKPAVVLAKAGRPVVELAPGQHELAGRFLWDTLPESIGVPADSGLVSLSIGGARVAAPQRDAQGLVWLHKSREAEEGDALEIVVHRRVEDEVPLRLITRIQLAISGKSRELLLGKALPAGFVSLALDAQVPARVEADGRLRVQARPGTYVIELTARSEGPVTSLARPRPDGPWRDGDEVWVFAAHHELRVAEVTGVAPIDPQQTSLPEAWRSLPAFPMKLGDTMRLTETRRGDSDPPPDRLSLDRTMWLDFEGGGMTFSDKLTGTLSRSTRLEMLPPISLGRVAIRNKDQFITQLAGKKSTGVEVRQGELDVRAEGRYEGDTLSVPAVGWDHDFASVSASLHVPPGFRLLHASGVDDVPGTWISHWRLLEIFLVLVLSLATARLFGPLWGAVALVTLTLTFPEGDAPKWAWVAVLAVEAVVRALPEGKIRRLFKAVRLVAAASLALIAVPFLIEHVRGGVYPALSGEGAGADDGWQAMGGERAEAPEQAVLMQKALATAAEKELDSEDEEQKHEDKKDGKPADINLVDKSKSNEPADMRGRKAPGSLLARSASYQYRSSPVSQLNIDIYDPNASVQTGPGLPSWRWTTVALRWSGPVDRGQQLRLYLASPTQNLLLALLRAALLVAMVLRTLTFLASKRTPPGGGSGRSVAPVLTAAAFACALLWPRAAAAEAPSAELLAELQSRLLAPPPCMPDCVSSSRMWLDVRGNDLRLRVAIDAGARVAVPLPGHLSQWLPTQVEVDGKPASALLLRDGRLHVALDPGSHEIIAEGPLAARETVQLALALRPRRVEAATQGWKLEGLHEDGLSDESLQLTRLPRDKAPGQGADASLEAGALPPFVRVERTLRIGLAWQIETRVIRVSPPGTAVVLEIPTLPGESVTTADVRAAGGKVQVNLAASAAETSWRSVLDSKSPLALVAPKTLSWVEVWRLDLSPIWHASFDGIPAVHPGARRGATMPEWRPWPGESLRIAITRPDGVAGQTLTVDRTTLDVKPGLRSTDTTLTISLRSSRGGQHSVELPEGAVLEVLKIGNTAQPIRQEGRRVVLPIVPGAQVASLSFREPGGMSTAFRVSPVNLGTPSVNSTVRVTVSDARWILFLQGPRLGPAVLFWSLLLVLGVVSAALGRLGRTPLSTGAWLLLSVGLSQVSAIAAAVVVVWLLALAWRERRTALPRAQFNLRQLLLAALTLAALVVLLIAVHHGLLARPDMQIQGGGSSLPQLQWYQDRALPTLPRPSVYSVPMLAYRATMLAWALWLAFSVLRWIRWGWGAFSADGLWRGASPPPAAPAAPAAPAPAAPSAEVPPEGPVGPVP